MTDSIDEKAQALKDIEACLDEAVKYLVDLAGAKPDKHSPQNCRLRIDEARLYAKHLYALPAAPMPGVKEEHIERARRIVQGRGFNRPNDIPGERIVGFAVPEDVAGLSEALFALDAIRSAILHAPRLSALDVPAHPEGVKAANPNSQICGSGA